MGLNSLNFSPFFLSGLPGVELNQSLKKSVTIHPDQLPWAGQGCGEDWREELQGPVKEPVARADEREDSCLNTCIS